MPSIGSITKTVRINAEDKAYIEEIMEEGQLTWSGAIHKLVSERVYPKEEKEEPKGVPKEERKESVDLSEIESMLPFLKLSMEEFVNKLVAAMNSGEVIYENGRFFAQSNEDVNLSRFKEACDEKGLDYQKTVDKMTQIVWQS